MMTFADTRINTGGMFRCCIDSIQRIVDSKLDETVPDYEIRMTCIHCGGSLTLTKVDDSTAVWSGTVPNNLRRSIK